MKPKGTYSAAFIRIYIRFRRFFVKILPFVRRVLQAVQHGCMYASAARTTQLCELAAASRAAAATITTGDGKRMVCTRGSSAVEWIDNRPRG